MMLDLIFGGAGGALIACVARLRRKPAPPPKEKQCAAIGINDAGQRCVALADSRCIGGNCTMHCRHGGCGGKCLDA